VQLLNLGILAHVDAGKTSLTERLLYAAGVIDEVGSVDDGTTQTDFLALERQRGITIKTAVVSFEIGGTTVNLIDTPGHPDFIAEVERVVSILDGAVLVVSAVEGVQPQTRILMRALRRLRIPTVVFVNKIDRTGAGFTRILEDLSEKLGLSVFAMGTTSHLGTRQAEFVPDNPTDPEVTTRLVHLLAEHDDNVLAAFVEDEDKLSYRRLKKALRTQVRKTVINPVFFGSALTGAGTESLIDGITDFLPAPRRDAEGLPSGTIFKVERGPAGEKLAYLRMFSGTINTRARLELHGLSHSPTEQRITGIDLFENGGVTPVGSITSGQIGKIRGLTEAQIGDVIGEPTQDALGPGRQFGPPTLEAVITPHRRSEKGALHMALTQLAEQDPLIDLRQDDIRQEIHVSLYGEVQKEVIQQTLQSQFHLDVDFENSKPLCIERLTGSGEAAEFIKKPPNPFLATVGLRIDPAPLGAGISYRLEVELGAMPLAFFRAVEESVRRTLQQGLSGWQVVDCIVTMTHSGYYPRQSHAHQGFAKSMSTTGADFRGLTPLVVMNALKRAGTQVHEPIHRFFLELPTDRLGATLPVLGQLRAATQKPTASGESVALEGDIPAANVHDLQMRLPKLTGGEGTMSSEFDHYRPVRREVPTRSRTDHNPLDRKEYLLHVLRRV